MLCVYIAWSFRFIISLHRLGNVTGSLCDVSFYIWTVSANPPELQEAPANSAQRSLVDRHRDLLFHCSTEDLREVQAQAHHMRGGWMICSPLPPAPR